MPSEESLVGVDAIFERFVAEHGAPGVVYGVVEDGRVVATGAYGVARLGAEAPPGMDTLFRIASMTKSFTAATVLMLRDEGRLRLDDEVAAYVPEVASIPPWSADSPPLSIRHLLTMTGGFPTDDPWGDRQQGLPHAEFAALLAAGVSLTWPPAVQFEYSNLGYAMLGRVVASATGRPYDEAIRTRLLEPLGLAATFDPDLVPARARANGYVRRNDAWLEEPIDGNGAFAPMGGLWASVQDLARWVVGFIDAFPARDDPDSDHPLRRASRREMQQIHVALPPELTWPAADAAPSALASGYGFGLFVTQDLALGRIVGHGGGYPGFGSHMRWHAASGTGIVALANSRYAPMGRLNADALRLLVPEDRARTRRHRIWPETVAARASVELLLARWDDVVAADLFAMNVDLDEPLAERRASFERLRAAHGALSADESTPAETYSRAHLAWWLTGERGRVKIEILLDPERPPRVQALTVTSVPDPPERLADVAAEIAGLLATPGPGWPAAIPLAASVDRPAVERSLRAAEARFGAVALGPSVAGDGQRSATWRLNGERGRLTLELGVESADGPLTKVALVPDPLEPPVDIA